MAPFTAQGNEVFLVHNQIGAIQAHTVFNWKDVVYMNFGAPTPSASRVVTFPLLHRFANSIKASNIFYGIGWVANFKDHIYSSQPYYTQKCTVDCLK